MKELWKGAFQGRCNGSMMSSGRGHLLALCSSSSSGFRNGAPILQVTSWPKMPAGFPVRKEEEGGRGGRASTSQLSQSLWRAVLGSPTQQLSSIMPVTKEAETTCCLVAGRMATLNKMRVLLVRKQRGWMLALQLAEFATDRSDEKKVAAWRGGEHGDTYRDEEGWEEQTGEKSKSSVWAALSLRFPVEFSDGHTTEL